MIVEAFSYSKETGKKYSGAVKISEQAYETIKSELFKENFYFTEGEKSLRANIIALKTNTIENMTINQDFSNYVNNLLIAN